MMALFVCRVYVCVGRQSRHFNDIFWKGGGMWRGGANNAQGFVGELEGSSDPESLDRNLSCTSEGLLLLFCMEFLLVWKHLM